MDIKLYLKDLVDISKVDSKTISRYSPPAFSLYRPNFEEITSISRSYQDAKNIVVIGNGGSITSFWALFKALGEGRSRKEVYIVSTMEPDFLYLVKERCRPDETVVIPISKSGNTVGVLEAMLAFNGYRMVAVTGESGGALREVVRRRDLDYLVIPDEIGGRFSGLTPCALFPAALCGLDIEEIYEGAREMYRVCDPGSPLDENPALRLAGAIYLLTKLGYTEVFHPVYSVRLEGFLPLFTQLIHESCGKSGKGITFYGALAPESQHHTNQRFFGGPRNVFGLFLTVKEFKRDIKTKVPDDLATIPLKGKTLSLLDGIPLRDSLSFEFQGTRQDAEDKAIPHAWIEVERVEEREVGRFLGFIQYLAVHLSWLLGVNPFDQPQVEDSKKISYRLREQFSRL